jgi:hypothetical protein
MIIEGSKCEISETIIEQVKVSEIFQKQGFVYVISTEPYCRGEIINLVSSRKRARNGCFTKNREKRKAFYSKIIGNYTIPLDLVEEIFKEIK